jgi:hypothetical protein
MTPGMARHRPGAPGFLIVGEIPPISRAKEPRASLDALARLEIVASISITRSSEGEPMNTNVLRSANSILGTGLLISALLAGCGDSQASPIPSSSTGPQPSVAVSVSELPSPSAAPSTLPTEPASAPPTVAPPPVPTPTAAAPTVSLYVRVWSVNASVGPSNFFYSSLAISGGSLYYTVDRYSIRDDTKPTPLYLSPMTATVSQAGMRTILARIEQDGLLGPTHEFECAGDSSARMAGASTTYVRIVIDGAAHDLSGGCAQAPGAATSTPAPAPGTYDAFADLVAHLQNLSGWLGDDLGTPSAWDPTSMAVIADLPGEALWEGEIWGHPDSSPGTARWLLGTWSNFGKLADPSRQERCAILSRADLATQLPSIKAAHAGTVFVDGAKDKRVLAVRPLLPGETPPSFCG